jgi:adenosylcobinamide hydrolase
MNLDFPNVTARCQDDLLILESTEPLHILSSAMIGGGCNIARTIVNAHVDKNLGFSNPAKHLQDRVRAVGIEGDFVGLMTAVFLDTVQVCTKMKDGMMVTAVVTAGIGNATRPGLSYVGPRKTGTINTTLPIDCDMEPSAMVNAVITATETKTDVLKELAIPTHDGQGTATGTSSDAIVIACIGKNQAIPYAGPATVTGWLIGHTVRKALEKILS